jgi:hypothetical protein
VTLAARATHRMRVLDAPANAITDAMNAAVPWLWWPLRVPDAVRPMPGAAHVLYVVHAVALERAGRAAGIRVGPWRAAVLALLGWLWFTGAWDRRALAAAPHWG